MKFITRNLYNSYENSVEHMQAFLLWLNMHVASIKRLNVPPSAAPNLQNLKRAKTFALKMASMHGKVKLQLKEQ